MRQIYEYHPVVGYRFVPNLKVRIPHEGGGYLMQINESGFRSNRPFVKERTKGSSRVLFFSDSFTAGDAVANAQRFTDLLETKIPASEIYNFGLPASGTDQQYLVWREFAQGIEHDLVVIAGRRVGHHQSRRGARQCHRTIFRNRLPAFARFAL